MIFLSYIVIMVTQYKMHITNIIWLLDEGPEKTWICTEEGDLVNGEGLEFHPDNLDCEEAEGTYTSTRI